MLFGAHHVLIDLALKGSIRRTINQDCVGLHFNGIKPWRLPLLLKVPNITRFLWRGMISRNDRLTP